MKKVYQTRMHTADAPGNCFPACIASLLECSINEVPWPEVRHMDDWPEYWLLLVRFLGSRGFTVIEWRTDGIQPFVGDTCADVEALSICGGPTKRGGVEHAVVYKGGRCIHDPLPEGEGLLSVTTRTFIVPLDPLRPYMNSDARSETKEQAS